MTAQPAVFLSHTTRDKRDFALAHKLASALRLRGADVWIAPESIPPGERWAADIVEGVMQGTTHFLVILSAASVQAEWVLREIELAHSRQQRDVAYRILPLVVGTLGSFPGKEYLDALQQVPYHDEFSAQLNAVAAALGLRPSARVAFPPTAVPPGEFVGREYVFDAIASFIDAHPNGYFVIEGDPGAGKSAILSEFVRSSGCTAFFNVRSLGVNTARQFLESVCAQLITRYGLDYPALPPEAALNGAFLSQCIDEASARLSLGEKLIIAVDALDEVDMTGHPAGANVLFLPARLPDRAYVVATRRQVTLPFTVHTSHELYDLLAHRQETEQDTRIYVERAARGPGVQAWMEQRAIEPEVFITEVVRQSEGNFMYLRHVLPEIAAGKYDDLDIQSLPRGLEGYYEDHWRRMGMTTKPLPIAKIRIVYVLGKLRKPLSRKLIAQLSSDPQLRLNELMVQDVLDEWDEFLHEQVVDGTKRYSIYHASFRDFLHRRDIVQAAGVTIKGINALIAGTMWDQLFAERAPYAAGARGKERRVGDLRARIAALDEEQRCYTLENLASHLAAADQYNRLRTLFDDDAWLHARVEYSGFSYDADLALAWDHFAQPRARAEAEQGDVPVALSDVVRFALIRTSLNSVAGNNPPEIVVRAVETGLWSAERALAIAGRVPEPAQRAALITRLLAQERLSEEQRDRARTSAIEALRAIGKDKNRAEALAALGPHLTLEFAEHTLTVARSLGKERRARALAAVAPLFTGDTRRAILAEAVAAAAEAPSYEPPVWDSLAPALDPAGDADLVQRAIEQVRKAGKNTRDREAPALAALRRIKDDKDRVYTLRETMPHLAGSVRKEAAELGLETALRLPPIDMDYDIPQIVGLLAAVPALDAAGLERALHAAKDASRIGYIRNSVVDLLVAIAERLDGAKRQEVVSLTLGLAQRPREKGTDEGPWEIRPLASVLPLLDANQRDATIRKALARALQLLTLEQRNELVNPRAEALAMLAPLLPAELLETAYTAARRVEDGEARALALTELGSRVDGPDRDFILKTAADSLEEIGDGGLRAKALARLAPVLTAAHFEIALDAALGIRGELDRGKALEAVNPHVPRPLQEKALRGTLAIEFEPARADALAALIPVLLESRLAALLDDAWAIEWEPGRTECVAAIAARLPPEHQAEVLDAALEAYRARDPDHMSGDMLLALAPLLTGEPATEGLRLALELSSELDCAKALAALAPNIAPEHLEVVVESLPALEMWQRDVVAAIAARLDARLLARTLDLSLAAEFDINRAECVIALFPYLDEALRGRALETAGRTGSDIARVLALEGVAPHLSAAMAGAATQAAIEIGDPGLRARALAAISARLEGEARDHVLEASLDAALATKETWPRANALLQLIPHVAGATRAKAVRVAVKAARAATRDRKYREPGRPLIAFLPELHGANLAAAVKSLLAMSPEARADTFTYWTVPATPSQLRIIRRAAADHLLTLCDADRAAVLRVLALPIFAPPVVPAEAVARIGRITIDVSTNWAWP
jgi:hypothetical protein